MKSAEEYVERLQMDGRLSFTTEEVVRALGKSEPAVRAQVRRLKRRGLVCDPYRGFHVVVPPAHRRLGCLPAEQFVPQLMEHLDEPYYAALLTAAAFHGAAHQKPQRFQVMVRRARRSLECGGVRVDFVVRRDMAETTVIARRTPAGSLRVASAAATAVELVGYPQHSGYLDNVASVLGELAASIDPDELVAEACRAPVAWVQRLGYLLVMTDCAALADRLDEVLIGQRSFVVALAPWAGVRGARRDERWKVAINTDVEPDT